MRHHFAAVLRDPFRCPHESVEAVFPYCAGFLVGIVATALPIVLILLTPGA